MRFPFLIYFCLFTSISFAQRDFRSSKPSEGKSSTVAPAPSGFPKQIKMSHEEELVRIAYAKLSYAAQIGMLWHAVAQHNGWPSIDDEFTLGRAMNDQLRFELSGFKVGNISEIANTPWSSLIEGPVDVLFAIPHTAPVNFESGNSKIKLEITYADVAWKKSSESPVEKKEDTAARSSNSPTVEEVIKSLKKPVSAQWSRFASYSVVAILRGQAISYRATFLFSDGKNGEILPLDYAATNGVGLFVNSAMYPAALVETAFREIPFIQGWISANEISGCKKRKEPEVCCDPSSGRCGLASEDVQRSMSIPVDPNTRWLITRKKEGKKGGGWNGGDGFGTGAGASCSGTLAGAE